MSDDWYARLRRGSEILARVRDSNPRGAFEVFTVSGFRRRDGPPTLTQIFNARTGKHHDVHISLPSADVLKYGGPRDLAAANRHLRAPAADFVGVSNEKERATDPTILWCSNVFLTTFARTQTF
jgi:hypothetical protein